MKYDCRENATCTKVYEFEGAIKERMFGKFICEMCISPRENTLAGKQKIVLNRLLNPSRQDDNYNNSTGRYTIYYSLDGFHETEKSDDTPSKESVLFAMKMLERSMGLPELFTLLSRDGKSW